jgi:hypothetical protein
MKYNIILHYIIKIKFILKFFINYRILSSLNLRNLYKIDTDIFNSKIIKPIKIITNKINNLQIKNKKYIS